MGYTLKATCSNCKLNKSLTYGAGMMNFEKQCFIPAIDDDGKLISADSKDEKNKNLQYYTVPMSEEIIDNIDDYIEWMDYALPRENNKCPQCSQHSLRFEVTALFD